jgi:predicted dehydrogenase
MLAATGPTRWVTRCRLCSSNGAVMRVGLVGIGDAGRLHARALTSGVARWTAVCARDPERIRAFRSAVGAGDDVVAFTSFDHLLASGACEAVILATPDGLHAEQAVAAARRGLHVLVEKPLAYTSADGQRAIEAARAAGVHLAVGYHLRHHAGHRLALEKLDEWVGPVKSIFVRWAWPDPSTDGWRARGEGAAFWSMSALGTHGIDLAMAFARGAAVERVSALLSPANGIDRAAEVSLAFAGGALAHVSVSVEHRASSRLLVSGEGGELEAIGTLGARGEGELLVRRAPVPFIAENPYVAQLRDFVAQCAHGFVENAALAANLQVLDRIRRLP